MKKLKIQAWVKILLVCIFCVGVLLVHTNRTEAGNLIVVLDAGHDDTHVGASGNNLKEENLNLKIAQACKEELEKYDGVTVYMIREKGACPYGGWSLGGSVSCNLKRVEFAAAVGADVYVSLHNNSSVSTAAKGTSVYYPTTNYKYQCGVTGAGLASSVLNQLLTLGLENRGASVRYSEDNTRYPDGSLADYYGVIKNSKLKGIPAIIVEHAFISNKSDAVTYLNTDEKLKKLGKLDAKGIAEYYGLKKKLDYSKATVTSSFANNYETVALKASGIKGADSVQYAVWSVEGGKDDLVWYSAQEDASGNWKADIPLKNHATEGTYIVHTYAEGEVFVKELQFQVTGPTADGVAVTDVDGSKGIFHMSVEGVTSVSDIDSVSVAVWNENRPSDVKWIPAKAAGNNVFVAVVDIGSFNYEYGTYQMHTYVRDKNGIAKCVDIQSYALDASETQLEVTGSGVWASYYVTAKQVPYGLGMSEVVFRVMPVTGESVYVEYKAVQQDIGYWSASVYPAEIGKPEEYKIEAYGKVGLNKEVALGECYFTAVSQKTTLQGVFIEPWCDYKMVRETLEQSEYIYQDYIAFQVMDYGNEVTSMAIEVPEYMKEKELEVFCVVSSGALEAVTTESLTLQGQNMLMLEPVQKGVYVIASKVDSLLGDADLNRKIELKDAQRVLRAALLIEPLPSDAKKTCDVDKDGEITLKDAQLILKKALYIITDY